MWRVARASVCLSHVRNRPARASKKISTSHFSCCIRYKCFKNVFKICWTPHPLPGGVADALLGLRQSGRFSSLGSALSCAFFGIGRSCSPLARFVPEISPQPPGGVAVPGLFLRGFLGLGWGFAELGKAQRLEMPHTRSCMLKVHNSRQAGGHCPSSLGEGSYAGRQNRVQVSYSASQNEPSVSYSFQ
jgi:hypothetical protein